MPILLNKYKYDRTNIIGKGGFSSVYEGYDTNNSNKVAIKIDKSIKYNKKESIVYDAIKNEKYMAKKIDFVCKTNASYLIMPLYEFNCEKMMKMNANYFNEKDVLMLGIQIIQQLNNLHKNDILHQDVKPDNFVFDRKTNKFKLIDFGLCKKYVDDEGHIEFKKNTSRCGTLRYMSTNCHLKYSLSRRDDLISLSYSLIYLYLKSLPWKSLKTKTKSKTRINSMIKDMKDDFFDNINDYNIPSPLLLLFTYSCNLRFNSKPDYCFLIKGIYTYLKMNGMKYDGNWSWKKDLN